MTTKYKHIVFQVLLAMAIVFSTSCEKALDLQPESEIGEGDFYTNAEEIDLATISIYNSLHGLMQNEWLVTEMRSDNSYMNPDASESKDIENRDLDRFVQSSQNQYIESYWRAAYRTIALANTVLENMVVVENTEQKQHLEAEARFLRGFVYFRLVRLYGGVFIIDSRITGKEAKAYSRSSEAKVYDFLIEDLNFAQEFLPTTRSTNELGRVNSYVAKGILAKALLTRKQGTDVTDALAHLKAIETSGLYGLELDGYNRVFAIDNEYNEEILFAVRYLSGSVGLGSPFANLFAPMQSDNYVVNGNGEGDNYPTQAIADFYETGDTRRDVCLKDGYIGQGDAFVSDRYINKFMSNVPTVDDAENDWPILRYADVMLLIAEAMNEKSGPSVEAAAYVNGVRNRAGLTDLQATDYSSSFALKLAIEKERRAEFAFENQRWFDLIRTGRAVTVMNQHFRTEFQYNNPDHPAFNTSDIADWQLLLPIPQFEIDLNPSITQNYGY